jgi:glutamate--cysteine ligase
VIAPSVPTDTSLVRERVARLFLGSPSSGVPRVGAEVELFVIRPAGHAGPAAPAARADVEQALRLAPASLTQAGPISFEPGGQVELSLHPADGVSALLGRAGRALSRLTTATERSGLALVATGTDPLPGRLSWDLQIAGPRYSVMQAHFDRLGGQGRRMMRQTAALQVCVALPAGRAGIDAWLVLNRAAPVLAAAFADSPVIGGVVTGLASNRLGIWLETDRSRTGFGGDQLDAGDPVAAYTRFALEALAMPLPRPDGAPEHIQDTAGVDHHLSTLFPPVRPRGDYLEVRSIDALPWRWAQVAITLVSLLAHDATVRSMALECLGEAAPATDTWTRACRLGPRDAQLSSRACSLLELAARAAPRRAARRLDEYRERFPASFRCPGDDLAELLERTPEALATWV